MAHRRPNIVMIVAHDLGRYCGCYGAAVATPSLNGLASDGVMFTQHHCTAAQCSPARGSMITGRYPHNNGLVGLAHVGWDISEGVPTLQQQLRAGGYSTHLFGTQHETRRGDEAVHALGYDEIHKTGGLAPDLAAGFAEWLNARREDEEPFFASIGTGEPHRTYPLDGPDLEDPAEVTPLPWLPDRPGIRRDIAGLNSLVRRLDSAVGTVREAIERSPLGSNTVFIVTTDHSIAMPRAKCTCYDPGTGVALLMRLPGRWEGGRTQGELLTSCDLMPTLLDLADLPEPEGMDGRSFRALLDGESYEPRDHIFTELTYHVLYNPMRAIRTRTHKYIRNLAELPLVHMPSDIFNSPSGEEMRDEYYSQPRPREELYDLTADSWEMTNLAGTASNEKLLCELANSVDVWMEATGDLLLSGRWPANETLVRKLAERRAGEGSRTWLDYAYPDQTWFLDQA